MAQGSAAVLPALPVGIGESVLDSADHFHCEWGKGSTPYAPLCPCVVHTAAALRVLIPVLPSCRWTAWLPAKWTHPSTPPAGTAWCKVGCSVIALESRRPCVSAGRGVLRMRFKLAAWPGLGHPSAPASPARSLPASLPCNAMQPSRQLTTSWMSLRQQLWRLGGLHTRAWRLRCGAAPPVSSCRRQETAAAAEDNKQAQAAQLMNPGSGSGCWVAKLFRRRWSWLRTPISMGHSARPHAIPSP